MKSHDTKTNFDQIFSNGSKFNVCSVNDNLAKGSTRKLRIIPKTLLIRIIKL